MNSKKSNYLVMIVGMHRSGTSAVGKLLQNIGFEFGSNLLEGINSINDEGFWEDKEVITLNEHIFELYDFDWFDFERMPGKWWEDEQIKDLIGVAETWYYETFSRESPIAVKDPRFCRLLPFWKRVFQGMNINLHVLFVYRHPVEVAASLKKRDNFPVLLGYLLWLSYTIDALYYSRNLNLSLLHYEELLERPNEVISRLLDTDLLSAGFSSQLNEGSLAEKSLDSARHHQKIGDLLNEYPCQGDVQELALELYQELLTASADAAKGLADKYRKRLYRLLDHHKEVLSALREETYNQVINVQKLFKLGDNHAHALAVIREKDIQLEENKDFITRCLAEIENKDSLLNDSRASPQINHIYAEKDYVQKFENWMSDLNRLVDDYRAHIEEQKKYIVECEEKIAFQEKGLADNQDYIAKCHARIAEQDAGIAENRGYITACEERIRAQDEGLSIRDKTLDEKDSRILDLEKTIFLLRENIDFLEKSLSSSEEKNTHINEEISNLQNKISWLEESIIQYRTQLDISQEKNSRINEEISNYQNRISQQEESILQYRTQLGISEEKLSASILQAGFLEKSILDLQKQLDQCWESIRVAESNFGESQLKIGELNNFLQAQQEEIGKYAEKARIDEQKLKESQANIIALDATLLELNNLIGRRDNTLQENILLIQSQMAKIKETETLLAEKMALLDLEGQKIAECSTEINRLQNLDKINHQRLALQKVQLEKSKAHGAALESQLIALQAEHDEWGRQLERYRSYRMVKAIDKLFPET